MKKLKEKLNAKLSKNGGFTLVEMLIVVAIIAILIAISIPLIGANLEQARVGVDQANERTALSMAEAYYLSNYDTLRTETSVDLYYYIVEDTHAGKIAKDASEKPTNGAFNYGLSETDRGIGTATPAQPKGAGIKITINGSGDVTALAWTKTGLS